MAEGILGRIGQGTVANLLQRKTLSRIFHAAHHRVTRAQVRNLHKLLGIEIRSMLDGVPEDLPERGRHVLASGRSAISLMNCTKRSAVLTSQLAARRIQLGVAERTSMPSSQHGPSAAERIMSPSDSSEKGLEKKLKARSRIEA